MSQGVYALFDYGMIATSQGSASSATNSHDSSK